MLLVQTTLAPAPFVPVEDPQNGATAVTFTFDCSLPPCLAAGIDRLHVLRKWIMITSRMENNCDVHGTKELN